MPKDDGKLCDIEFDRLLEGTKKAFYIQVGDKRYWLPRSQCELAGDANVVTMPEWLAIEKELV